MFRTVHATPTGPQSDTTLPPTPTNLSTATVLMSVIIGVHFVTPSQLKVPLSPPSTELRTPATATVTRGPSTPRRRRRTRSVTVTATPVDTEPLHTSTSHLQGHSAQRKTQMTIFKKYFLSFFFFPLLECLLSRLHQPSGQLRSSSPGS